MQPLVSPSRTITGLLALGAAAMLASCAAAMQEGPASPAAEVSYADSPAYRSPPAADYGDAARMEESAPMASAEYSDDVGADYDAPGDYAEAEAAPAAPSRRDRRRSRASGEPPPPPAAAPSRRPAPASGGAMTRSSLDAMPPAEAAAAPTSGYGATGGYGPTPPPPPRPAPVVQQVVQISRLTAASVGDADRRGPYLDYLSRHPAEQARIGLNMSRRIRFRILGAQARPLHDAVITMTAGGRQITGRTHADGYWDFFPSVMAPQARGPVQVRVQWRNQQTQTTVVIPPAGDGADVAIQLPQAVAVMPANLDLAFLIDVTGSMGDELAYVNHELAGIVQQVRAAIPQVNVRVGATFYRDRADFRPLEQLPFSTDVTAFISQMAAIQANGGGDYPEDLNAGIEAVLTTQQWSTGPAVRVLVVISDAPPQNYPDSQYTYLHAMTAASERGIRILPVAASGADRVVEFLFRAMGAFTSTPYVYLTDDSGVGGHHMEADTDRIHVEMFSELLTRLLIADMQGQGMHEPSHADQGQGGVLVPMQ